MAADVARKWFAALGPHLRAQMMQILALRAEPTEEQIAELPELITPAWRLDMMGIAEDYRPAIRAAIGELAAQLGTGTKRRKRR